MRITRRGKIIFFLSLGVVLAAIAVFVGSGWIILNWREGIRVLLGFIFFGAIVAGLILNTSFLVREIRKNEQHDSFINAVTHELKTPIASIRLYVQTLQRRELEEAQRRDFYRLMIEDTDRLSNTVEQVLKAGRAGARKAEHVEVDFAGLVERCVETARNSYHLQPEALRYESSLNGRGSEVTGDPEDLRTAVSNLLDNAVKYSGNHIDISVHLDLAEQKRLVLRVQDRGVGIPRTELKSIFKRFYRVPSRALKQVRGTGLGLFLVRTIAKRHGGRVSAESAGEGKGATVIFELPPEGVVSRVLIVEDEAHIANGLQFNLQAEGHAAQVAGDGETALDLLLAKQEAFDAMVLDVMLPGKNGFAVAADLRAARNFIPILMLTARGRPEDVLKGFASGADDYLAKPFELPILLARLQGLLRRKEWMQHPATAVPASTEPMTQPADEFGEFSFAGRTIDFRNLVLRAKGTTTQLTVMEADLLRHLVRNRGKVVSRKSILEEVWGLREDTDTRAIDNFIVRLRRYLEDNPVRPKHLLTVRGVGYRFVAEKE